MARISAEKIGLSQKENGEGERYETESAERKRQDPMALPCSFYASLPECE